MAAACTRVRAVRAALAGAAGGICGYLACAVAANLEAYQFYTVRRWVTGESVMSSIVQHPADRWVTPAIVILFVSVGVAAGVVASLRHQAGPPVVAK
jgi:hypothetical protein